MKLPAIVRLFTGASLAILVQLSVHAHTVLTESSPGDGATIKESPTHVNLVFNGPVKLIKFELMGTGHEMPTKFESRLEAKVSFMIETPGMHPGNFTVNWAVIGADGHTVTNSYSFLVDPDAVAADAGHNDHAGHDAEAGHGHDGDHH